MNSSKSSRRISLALMFGAVTGLTTIISPHNLSETLFPLIISLKLSTMLVSALIFSGAAYVLYLEKVPAPKFLKTLHTDHKIS